jgi:hypothetical protein
MVDHNKIAELVNQSMEAIEALRAAGELQWYPYCDLDDLETIESYGWHPVDMVRRQMLDDGTEVTNSEFQAAWEAVDANVREMSRRIVFEFMTRQTPE